MGKVRKVNQRTVRVSIWEKDDRETVGDLYIEDMNLPDNVKLENGLVFKYCVYQVGKNQEVRYEYPAVRRLTKREIEEIEEEVHSSLEGIDLDVL